MKIGIIGAMDEEVERLKEKLEQREDIVIAESEFSTGKLENQDIILLKSGIGKVNAAIGTTLLNQLFSPEYVINTGSAGGFHKELNVGDVVISTEVRHHDVDVTAFGYEYGQVPKMPASFLPDPHLMEIAINSAEKLTGVQVVEGLVATGDSFMNDPERVDYVRSKFPNLYAVEMEAAAIAQVCYQFKVPFIIIRSLSDIAGKESKVSFEQFLKKAAVNSANLVIEMVKELKSND
ncbi:5'-methylthioadenosine/S-adenosylhomocysteine nucleosidase [Tepidibacillus decaturensis]|uniref:5'-methylthioadenosine/S-adenosylhomocysteine nucleosidase n=1 Tax=Tepidibacillus decaturensis TaxID=1413211 RepID=A0A135L1S2_9BACI|nr:5'-methylthioadenosine/S-adenosylhomocysteine nucleosidase [Tepidibacillus decaturensis]KXG42935.1 5'-methylthioadenosine nucleosidase [Tepidibacillus decaturensis]